MTPNCQTIYKEKFKFSTRTVEQSSSDGNFTKPTYLYLPICWIMRRSSANTLDVLQESRREAHYTGSWAKTHTVRPHKEVLSRPSIQIVSVAHLHYYSSWAFSNEPALFTFVLRYLRNTTNEIYVITRGFHHSYNLNSAKYLHSETWAQKFPVDDVATDSNTTWFSNEKCTT